MYLQVILVCSIVQLIFGHSTLNSNSSESDVTYTNCHDFDSSIAYPSARRNESLFEIHHGVKVADPYRWLEDPDSIETKQFIDAENKVSDLFLKNCNEWSKVNEKLTTIWNYAKFSVPERQGKYYFWTMNTGLQNQNVLYKQMKLDDEPTVLLDPNKLSTDGTVSLSDLTFSEDGNLLAYAISASGSDWSKIKIRDVETGEDYPETLEQVKFSTTSWTHDNKGFFYARFPNKGDGSETDKNENQKLYYHRVGEEQEKDVLTVEFPENPSWRMSTVVSHDGKYLLVFIDEKGDENLLYYADLEKNGEITGNISLTPIITEFQNIYWYVTNIGSKMVFHTNQNAPNNRLVVIDFKNPAKENWTTLIEESFRPGIYFCVSCLNSQEHPNDVLDSATCVDKNKILAIYLHDVKSVLQVHSLDTGKLIRRFPLEIGDIAGLSGSKKYSEFFFQLKSYLTPGTIYRYDFSEPNASLTVFREAKLNLDGFDKKNFDVKQVFYPSRDGTKIPMFIVQKKSTHSGPKPTLLYGYGGFRISETPLFSPSWLLFVNSFDGIVAIANIRGGGEYGDKWHDAGRLLNKQNVFNDFQDAAIYLVEQKYTEHKRIAIQGGSNGGLLVGACINQRPDLFGAAIAEVGVMDMLRYHKFTIGAAWISDFGDPEEKIHFENLLKYSPLHNVHSPNSTENQYPATLITTGDHDDRVSPLHSLKFAAAMHHAVQANKFQRNPILLRVYKEAGHGGGKPTSKAIESGTDVLTFLYRAFHLKNAI